MDPVVVKKSSSLLTGVKIKFTTYEKYVMVGTR